MNTNNHPHNPRFFLSQAEDSAAPAQQHGKKALELYQHYPELEQKADAWDKIFSSASPTLITICCLACACVEGAISADVYRELIPYGLLWILADVGMLLLAIKTGHYLRSISSEEIDLMHYEECQRNPHLSDSERNARVVNDCHKGKLIGWCMFIITTVLVLGLSYHRRVVLLQQKFSILDLMPAVFYALTIISSIHVFYTVKRFQLARTIRRMKRQYATHNKHCQEHTATTVHYFSKARSAGEDTSFMSNDLRETLHRYLSNSSLQHDYAHVHHEPRPATGTLPEPPETLTYEDIPSTTA